MENGKTAGAAINESELHNRFATAIAVFANSYLRLSRIGVGNGQGEAGAGKLVAFADCAQSQSETQASKQTGTGTEQGESKCCPK